MLAAVTLSACTGMPLLDPVDSAVADALRASRAGPAEQRAALAHAQERFAGNPSSSNRLHLATLLVALPAPLRDDARAAELLEPIADPASPGTGRFAALLAGQAAERQRLVREAERASRERERERGERAAADKERDKREEALRQQLEALRSIERGILEREDRLRRKAR